MPPDEPSATVASSDSRRPGLMRRMLPVALLAAFMFSLLEVGSYAYLRMFRGYDGEHLMNYEFDPYKNVRPSLGSTRVITFPGWIQ